jgi:hypothetical protein
MPLSYDNGITGMRLPLVAALRTGIPTKVEAPGPTPAAPSEDLAALKLETT